MTMTMYIYMYIIRLPAILGKVHFPYVLFDLLPGVMVR